MAFPRKPRHLKAIAGSRQPDPLPGVQFPALLTVPVAPDWLPNSHAVKEWDRLAPILVANNVLAEADLSSLGVMCALLGRIIQLFAAGETPTGHLVAQYNALASAFGVAPSWRDKVKPIGEKSRPSKFSSFKKRHE